MTVECGTCYIVVSTSLTGLLNVSLVKSLVLEVAVRLLCRVWCFLEVSLLCSLSLRAACQCQPFIARSHWQVPSFSSPSVKWQLDIVTRSSDSLVLSLRKVTACYWHWAKWQLGIDTQTSGILVLSLSQVTALFFHSVKWQLAIVTQSSDSLVLSLKQVTS